MIGVPRNKHGDVDVEEFINVTIKGQPAKKLGIARLERHVFKIYLTTSTKRCLSRLTTKRLYTSKTRSTRCWFSLPLDWKQRLDDCI